MQTDEQKVVNLKGFLPFLNTEKKEKALSLIEDMIRIRAYYFWEKTGENAKFCWEQASEKFPTYNERFEFLLYINGKIICQRCFNIPNFNEASINSLELKEIADDCVWLIEDDLKQKTNESLWFYFREFEKHFLC